MSGEKMSEKKKMTEETKLSEETKLFEEKKVVDPFIVGFFESMSRTNTEKITKEILEGLSKDSDDSDSMTHKVEMKTLKVGRGDQAIPSSESQLLKKIMLMI
jgi:hypothetical protein